MKSLLFKFDYTSIDVSQIFYLIDLLVNSEDGKVPAPIPRQQIKGKCKSCFCQNYHYRNQ